VSLILGVQYTSFYVDNSSFRNKYDGQHYEDTSYGENIVVVFCQNQTYDIAAFNNAYVENYWCSYSSPTEGSTVYGEVIWYTWNFCGMYKMAADAERRLMFKTNEEELGYAEFKRAMAQYKTVRDKIRIDRKEGKTNAVENHTIELLESVTKFKEFLNRNRGSKYSTVALSQISAIYGLLRLDEELMSYMKGIAIDKELAHLRAEAYNSILTMYFKREENQKAVELSEQLTKEYPNHPLAVEWHYGQGLMYKYKMNDVVRAEEIFREVVEKYPAHGTAISAREHLGIKENAIAKEQALSSSVERELTILNYPNPFNPTTKIKYSIPETGLVVIKVYDMLGKEIETFILHS
jgi:tetratricopeptide (TPR) repeat protein